MSNEESMKKPDKVPKSSPPLKRRGKPMSEWPRVLDLDESRKRLEAEEDARDDAINPKRIMVDYSSSAED